MLLVPFPLNLHLTEQIKKEILWGDWSIEKPEKVKGKEERRLVCLCVDWEKDRERERSRERERGGDRSCIFFFWV